MINPALRPVRKGENPATRKYIIGLRPLGISNIKFAIAK
jgi:hypothetical protein